MKRKKLHWLHPGTEVVTDELRLAIVDYHYANDVVNVRYHSPPWPFPEWDIKTRCQLKHIPIQYQVEEAPF